MKKKINEKKEIGKKVENRKDVAAQRTSSQETYTLREYCDHCMFVWLHVCVRAWGLQ